MNDLTALFNEEISKEVQLLIYLIGTWAQKGSFKVYAAGGFVRDLLLGKENRDIDLVVEGSAVDFARCLIEILPGNLQCYERFGTATLFLKKGIVLDMVTARRELYAAPGALPEVEYSSLKNDLYRRDFTINTMALALNPGNFGKLYDYFGGQKDLKEGIIRVLYKLSFVDDPLRIIRAARFEQRFGFTIEEETFKLLQKAIKGKYLERVSKERLYNEVRLIFHEPAPYKVLVRLHELKLFPEIFPRVVLDREAEERFQRMEKLSPEFMKRVMGEKPNPFLLYLCLLLYGLKEHDLKYLAYRMRLRRAERRKLFLIMEKLPVVLEHVSTPELNPSDLYFLLEGLPKEALLLIPVFKPDHAVHERILYFAEHLTRKKPCLTGKELQEIGIEPGPIYQKILKELHRAVMDEKIKGREDEMKFVQLLLQGEDIFQGIEKGEE